MRDFKISNLLLNEILKSPVEIIDIYEFKCMIRNSTYFDNEQMGIVYRYLYGNEEIRFMSIYEFAFKCKEWACKYVSNIGSGYDKYKDTYWCICNNGEFQFYAETELEAIINSCEWILNQQKATK